MGLYGKSSEKYIESHIVPCRNHVQLKIYLGKRFFKYTNLNIL